MYTRGYAHEIVPATVKEPTFGVRERGRHQFGLCTGKPVASQASSPPAIPGHIRVAERDQFEREIASLPAFGVPRSYDQTPPWISLQQGVEPSLESAALRDAPSWLARRRAI